MAKDVIDRRVQKTRQNLQDALIGLIAEKGIDAVTIQEILDRANVGRSTFYTHFENKHELLHSCFEELHQLFEQYNNHLSKDQRNSSNLKETDLILELIRFAARNHRLFKAILGDEGITMFNQQINTYVLPFIDQDLKKFAFNKRLPQLQLEMLAHYLTSALVGTLKWWVKKDMPCTVEEVNQYFKQFALDGIRSVLINPD